MTVSTLHLAVDSTRPRWQRELAEAVRDPAELLEMLDLPASLLPGARRAAALFPLRVPRAYVRRMRRGDPDDPLLRQVLPLAAESDEIPGFVPDPLRESEAQRAPGLLGKYAGRVLLVTTGACAVHCRYCFRREFPYGDQQGDGGRWEEALESIRQDGSVREVILSGGDPLSLSDARLASLVRELEALPRLERLRIHTRQPIVLPARVDESLCAWLSRSRLPVVVVVHANHAAEIDAEVADALARLRGTGVTLLNQSVLLRGVNDDVEALEALSVRLHAAGVLPYYLHLLDRVRGTSHFEVEEARAASLIEALASRLPGYLVPKLAREEPGKAAKTVLRAGM